MFKIKIELAERLTKLPKYIFAAIEELKLKKKKEGIDLIPLGIGDPDIPTPPEIVEELIRQVKRPENHQYPTSMGETDFREAVARWNKVRYGLDFDMETEVTNVIGGKEGVANIARAFVNPGDIVLCPNPGYPVYQWGGTTLCDGTPHLMPLKSENNFLPDFDSVDTNILKKAKLLYLNYPNNPTGAIAPEEYLKIVCNLAEDYNFFVVYDNPYSEFTFNDYIAPTILQINREIGIEINSASKTFCMTGHRCGWAVGNKEIIGGLRKVKSQIDSGCPMYTQRAVAKALNYYDSQNKPEIVAKNMKTYEKRRDVLIDGLNKIGWPTEKPKATFYVWTKLPEGETDSMKFVMKLIEVGVVITPGIGFGEYGEGFVRFALTQPIDRIKEALERISKVLK